jgi:hypothetical protein
LPRLAAIGGQEVDAVALLLGPVGDESDPPAVGRPASAVVARSIEGELAPVLAVQTRPPELRVRLLGLRIDDGVGVDDAGGIGRDPRLDGLGQLVDEPLRGQWLGHPGNFPSAMNDRRHVRSCQVNAREHRGTGVPRQ